VVVSAVHDLGRSQHEPRRHPDHLHRPHPRDDVLSPIGLLATAIPPSTNLSIAIHVLHVLPGDAQRELSEQLLATARENAAAILHRCHRALEVDGRGHGYTPEDWLPLVYSTAGTLLESVRLDCEPPSIVSGTQEAVHWLASAVIELDNDSAETPAALADAIGRLLATCVFARTASHEIARSGG
jgi:hypothetical protein